MVKLKSIMNRRFLIITCCLMLAGCNRNESKEARIQKLEMAAKKAKTELRDLENRVHSLESRIESNEQ